ncbi:MAG: hypothetical protein HYW25_05385 [Candidatus Aenigmarchaeota archaeon]|nr:hypothetical protein [Candidatus Aenigmarchaeota archaeon]
MPLGDALERFMKVYANLPIEERNQVIAVIDEQPISWNMAYLEIRNKTELGQKISQKLIKLEII